MRKAALLVSLLATSLLASYFVRGSTLIEAALFVSPIIYVLSSIRFPTTESPCTGSCEWRGKILQTMLGFIGILFCLPGNSGLANNKDSLKYLISNIILDIVGWAFIFPLVFYIMVRQCRAWISPLAPRLRLGTFLFAVGCVRIIVTIYASILLAIIRRQSIAKRLGTELWE